jgi:hypothetical protein
MAVFNTIGKVIGKRIYIRQRLYSFVIEMGESTALTRATSKSDSLRTTVPKGIVRQFGLKEGDRLNWEIIAKGNKLAVVITPE